MEKVKELYHRYLWLIVLSGVLAIMGGVYWISSAYQEHKTESGITQNQTAAKSAVNAAITAETNAVDASIERRSEDVIRDKTIRPKLETARRNSSTSKVELERAKENFNEKADPKTINSSWADNCDRLRRMWPDTRFDYCEQ